ncbi:MAG: type II toxin-antitoxin system RelE family toxin [Thermoplasmata archaeon]
MAYHLEATESARREFLRLPRTVQRQFQAVFDLLVQNPLRSTVDIDLHQLRGGRGLWTLRVGRYRGLYRVDGRTVVFVAFRPRPVAYKGLSNL